MLHELKKAHGGEIMTLLLKTVSACHKHPFDRQFSTIYYVITYNLLVNKEREQEKAIFVESDHLTGNFYYRNQNNNQPNYMQILNYTINKLVSFHFTYSAIFFNLRLQCVTSLSTNLTEKVLV